MENLKLKTSWTVWENLALNTTQNQSDESWKKSIVKVATVSDLSSFASMWNNLPYHKPTQTFFFDRSKNVTKKFQIKDRDDRDLQQINAINIFRNEIVPAWEDPDNKNGGEYRIELGGNSSEEVDSIWQDLVLSLIGETFKNSDQVTGIRVLDRSKPPTFEVRLEIWVRYSKDTEKGVAAEFEKNLAEYLRNNQHTKTLRESDFLKYRSHK